MKVIFMGTPDFSVNTLKKIVERGHEVTLVVTQPDKARGRKSEKVPTPVKEAAISLNLPCFCPEKLSDPESTAKLMEYEADVIVVVAFGQILKQDVLEYPKYGCVNVHASLLPKYRGAAPIQWAVIDGEKTSGVTTMKMDEGLDTGDIIDVKEVELAEDETGGSLFDKLSDVGAELLVETLDKLENGSATFTKQDDTLATKTSIIKKDFGNIDFSRSATEIERLVRGLNPWPSAFTYLDGKMMKIWRASVKEADNVKEQPGTVIDTTKTGIEVACAKDILVIEELQLSGKKRMEADAFLRGYDVKAGSVLTSS